MSVIFHFKEICGYDECIQMLIRHSRSPFLLVTTRGGGGNITYFLIPINNLSFYPHSSLSGLFADKTGNYRLAVFLSLLLCLVFHIALLYVPPRLESGLTLSCGPDGHALSSLTCDPCDRLNDTELSLVLEVVLIVLMAG